MADLLPFPHSHLTALCWDCGFFEHQKSKNHTTLPKSQKSDYTTKKQTQHHKNQNIPQQNNTLNLKNRSEICIEEKKRLTIVSEVMRG